MKFYYLFFVICLNYYETNFARNTEFTLGLYFSTKFETIPTCQGSIDPYYYSRTYLPSQYAIEKINNSTDLLPNVTLKSVLLETCYSDVVLIKNTLLEVAPYWKQIDPIPPMCSIDNQSKLHTIIATIHNGWSREAIQISKLLQLNKMALISLTATSPELSDSDKHPFFFRMVPTNDVAALAAVKLLIKMQWTFVGLIFVDNAYGLSFAERFTAEASKGGLCLGLNERMKDVPTSNDIAELYKKIKKMSKLSILIFAVDVKLHVNPLINLMILDGTLDKYIWFVTDSFDIENVEFSPIINENVYIQGYQTFFPLYFDYEFENYLKSLSINNPMLMKDEYHRTLISESFNCDWSIGSQTPCSNQSLYYLVKGDMQTPKIRFYSAMTVDVIYFYATILHNIIRDYCPEVFQGKPIAPNCIDPDLFFQNILRSNLITSNGRNIKFKNNSGDSVDKVAYMEFKVDLSNRLVKSFGIFDEGNIRLDLNSTFWKRDPKLAPRYANCVEKCLVDEIKIIEEVTCCSTCRKCRDNEIKNINETKCLVCPINYWPDESTRLFCFPLQPEHITTKDTLFFAIASSAGVGETLSITVLIFICINRRKKLLMATSVPTSIGLLLAIGVIFAQSVFYFLPPDQFVCTAKLLFFHINYSIIYGLLLIKLLRIFLIFRAANNFTKATNLGNDKQFIGMFMIVSIQVIIVTVLCLVLNLPTSSLVMDSPFIPHVELTCYQDNLLLYVPIGYNIFIIMITAYLGYVTRKLPENFKETLNIFVCAMSTVFLWISFFPMYTFLRTNFNQVLLFLINIHFSGYFYIGSLFMPKLYGVMFFNEEQLKVKVWKSEATLNTVAQKDH